MKTFHFVIGILALIIVSCNPVEEYPVVPAIEYAGYTLLLNEDSIPVKGVIAITFTDGDGNIGLTDEEHEPPFDYNLFVTYREWHNGTWQPVINHDGDTVNFNARIPVITPQGKNKNIRGTIYDTVNINRQAGASDTVKYTLYVKDRDLNSSNMVETPPIKTSL